MSPLSLLGPSLTHSRVQMSTHSLTHSLTFSTDRALTPSCRGCHSHSQFSVVAEAFVLRCVARGRFDRQLFRSQGRGRLRVRFRLRVRWIGSRWCRWRWRWRCRVVVRGRSTHARTCRHLLTTPHRLIAWHQVSSRACGRSSVVLVPELAVLARELRSELR